MVELQFFPIDATYKIVEGKPWIYMFGKTPEGEQVCVIDNSAEPYFYVLNEAGVDIKQELLDLKDTDERGEVYSVTKIEEVEKRYRENPIKALKVFTNIPKAVAQLRDKAREIEGVREVLEADIQFVRRYFIDNNIVPLTLYNVTGEQTQQKLKVPAIIAEKIEAAPETEFKPKILAVDIETYNAAGKYVNPDKDPIVMLAVAGEGFEKVLTWKPIENPENYIEFVKSEADMLDRFAELVEEYKPDIITGYFSDGFDFPYIKKRAAKYKLKLQLGLDYSEFKVSGRGRQTSGITGIAHVDAFNIIRRLFIKVLETDVLTLDAVAKEVLGKAKLDIDISKLAPAWDENNQEMLNEFCKYNMQDAKITFELCEKIIPNLIEFVKLVGQQLFDVNRMSFSQLVEWYAMRQAFANNEIAPNKPRYNERQARMTDRIKGAFVLEPKPGLYDSIAVFDYRSLYPTIIASHNISPGMLNCKCCEGEKQIKTDRGTFWYCQKKKGFVSTVIEDLITRRSRIKEMLKKDPKNVTLFARSWALKDLANSFYGYLGFSVARWYCIECAESTTAFARQYIMNVIDKAKQEGFTVLYSDTDSVFLVMKDKTKEDGQKFVEKINVELPELMELEFEGFYPAGIFVSVKASEAGAKKKYALIDDKDNMKIVGFETVRRNVSQIARDVQKKVLEIVLRQRNPQEALTYLRSVIDDIKNHRLPVENLVIQTQLTKPIEEYESQGPHVAAAILMQKKGEKVSPGEMIKFVVTKGKGRIRDRVKLPVDAVPEDYDPDYYLNNQILPAVDRIFAVFDINPEQFVSDQRQQTLGGYL